MRELFEFQSGRRLCGVSIVRNHVAAPELKRVHADPGGGQFDEALGHRSGNWMANGSVLTHDIFILKNNARLRTIVRAGIWATDKIDDLVGFDAARAWVDRIGPNSGQIVDLEGGDCAVLADSDFCLDTMVARVNVGDKTFNAIGDELHRALEQL